MKVFFLAAAAALAWSASAHAEEIAPSSPIQIVATAVRPVLPTTEALTAPLPVVEMPMINQGAPGVRSLRIGKSKDATLGAKGCLLASALYTLWAMGVTNDTVHTFVGSVLKHGLTTARGLLYWGEQGLDKVFPVSTRREKHTQGRAAYNAAVNILENGSHVLIELRVHHPHRRASTHWVAVCGRVGNDLKVCDPNGGRTGALQSLYSIGAIIGYAVISRDQ